LKKIFAKVQNKNQIFFSSQKNTIFVKFLIQNQFYE